MPMGQKTGVEKAQEASDTYVVYFFNTNLPGTCLDKTLSP